MTQAISELNVDSSGVVSRRYTVGNVVEYTRDGPINITIEELSCDRQQKQGDRESGPTGSEDFPKPEGGGAGDTNVRKETDSEWSSPPVPSRPPRLSLPLASRPSLNIVPPLQQSPSLLSPPEEDLPMFFINRRRSNIPLPEILETPEDEDKGMKLFLQQRRKSLTNCWVRGAALLGREFLRPRVLIPKAKIRTFLLGRIRKSVLDVSSQ